MYTPEQAYQLILLFICIWREARGEPDSAKLGVGWVVRNRVLKTGKSWWGDDWVNVVLKKYQFSSFNTGDPNTTKFPMPDDPSYGPCLLAAKYAYEATAPDPTFGATYYHDTSITPPSWAADMDKTCQLGKLVFYRERVKPIGSNVV